MIIKERRMIGAEPADVFSIYGDVSLVAFNRGDLTTDTTLLTVENIYQAFKARLMAETQAQVLEDWGKRFDDKGEKK